MYVPYYTISRQKILLRARIIFKNNALLHRQSLIKYMTMIMMMMTFTCLCFVVYTESISGLHAFWNWHLNNASAPNCSTRKPGIVNVMCVFCSHSRRQR